MQQHTFTTNQVVAATAWANRRTDPNWARTYKEAVNAMTEQENSEWRRIAFFLDSLGNWFHRLCR